MTKEELKPCIGFHKSIDLEHDSRISVFTKAGSNAILFSLIVVGYFTSGEQILFPYRNTPTYILQLVITVIAIMFYAYIHDLLHYFMSKLVQVKLELKFKSIFPYIKYTGDIEKKSKYYLTILAPFAIFMIILIPLQILISIYAHDWFWLSFIVIIENCVVSIDDLAYVIYSMKYKNSYLQLSEKSLYIYLDKNKSKELRAKEKAKIQERINKQQEYNKMIEQIKNKNKNKNTEQAKQSNDDIDQDLEDLSKLDK